MPGSWEDYKERKIQAKINFLNEKFSRIESFIESPIERIAFYEIFDWVFSYMMDDIIELDVQRRFGRYRTDIYVCCSYNNSKLEIVVECDGHEFHEKTKEQASRDKRRDRYFTKLGIVTLRYSGSEIVNNPSVITADIQEILAKRFPRNFRFS